MVKPRIPWLKLGKILCLVQTCKILAADNNICQPEGIEHKLCVAEMLSSRTKPYYLSYACLFFSKHTINLS